jgi:hypothetical protein
MAPAELSTKFKFRFGPMMILAAKLIVNKTVDTPEVSEYLEGIRNVQVGVYDIEDRKTSITRSSLSSAERALLEERWEPFVRVRDREQQISLLYKYDNEGIRGVYVMVLNREQLILIEAQGHFEKIIETAIQQRSLSENLDLS